VESVGSELKPASNPPFQALQKGLSGVAVSFADLPIQNQFAGTFKSQENVLLATMRVVWVGVGFEAMDKAVNLVDLHVGHLQVDQPLVEKFFAIRSSHFQDVQHGVFVQAGQSANGATPSQSIATTCAAFSDSIRTPSSGWLSENVLPHVKHWNL